MDNHRVLGIGMLVLAALLVANPLYLYQHPDEINRVQVGNYYDRQPVANYTFEELSPDAQELVREAIESESNRTTFRGDANRPPEFQFNARSNASGLSVAGAVYRVRYEGETYMIETYEPPQPDNAESRRSTGLLGFGVTLAGVGALFVWREQPLVLGQVMGGLGAAFLLLNLGHRFTPSALGPLGAFGSPTLLLGGLLLGIITAGYLLYRTMREIQYGDAQ